MVTNYREFRTCLDTKNQGPKTWSSYPYNVLLIVPDYSGLTSFRVSSPNYREERTTELSITKFVPMQQEWTWKWTWPTDKTGKDQRIDGYEGVVGRPVSEQDLPWFYKWVWPDFHWNRKWNQYSSTVSSPYPVSPYIFFDTKSTQPGRL